MSIVDMEGFDWLPNTNNGNFVTALNADGWVGEVTQGMRLSSPGRFGFGNAMSMSRFSGDTGKEVYKILPRRVTGGFVVGIAWYQNTMEVDDNASTFQLYDSFNSVARASLTFNPFGKIRCAGLSSTIAAFIDNVWNYVELKGSIGTPGPFEVRLNGDIIISSGSLNFGEFDSLGFFIPGGNWAGFSFDDLYVLDNAGGVNTDYLGNIRVVAQRPVSDGDNIDLTPVGAATNWQASDNPALTGGKYVETDVVGDYDLYDMNPNVAARDIFGIQAKSFMLQNDGIQIRGGPIIKTDGVEYGSNTRGLAGGYRSVSEIWDRNPFTGNPWTSAELNVLQSGPKLVSSA